MPLRAITMLQLPQMMDLVISLMHVVFAAEMASLKVRAIAMAPSLQSGTIVMGIVWRIPMKMVFATLMRSRDAQTNPLVILKFPQRMMTALALFWTNVACAVVMVLPTALVIAMAMWKTNVARAVVAESLKEHAIAKARFLQQDMIAPALA